METNQNEPYQPTGTLPHVIGCSACGGDHEQVNTFTDSQGRYFVCVRKLWRVDIRETPAPDAAGEAGERLRQIRERLEAATPGPWTYANHPYDDWGLVRGADKMPVGNMCASARWCNEDRGTYPPEGPPQVTANGLFVAHAPEDIRYLLARLHAAEAAAEAEGARAGEWEREVQQAFGTMLLVGLEHLPEGNPYRELGEAVNRTLHTHAARLGFTPEGPAPVAPQPPAV